MATLKVRATFVAGADRHCYIEGNSVERRNVPECLLKCQQITGWGKNMQNPQRFAKAKE